VLDVLEGQHQQCNFLLPIEVPLRVFADLDTDLEEDVEDLVAVQLNVFVLIYSSLILYLSCFLNVVCRQFFSAL